MIDYFVLFNDYKNKQDYKKSSYYEKNGGHRSAGYEKISSRLVLLTSGRGADRAVI